MSGLTRGGTAELVSLDQILRRERGQGKKNIFPVAADHEQDWQFILVESNNHAYRYDMKSTCTTEVQ